MLQFIEVEKRINDLLLLPPFSLQVTKNEITSICSSLNIREQIIQLLRLQTTPSYGEILINGEKLTKNNVNQLGFFLLYEPLYKRLTVSELLQFVSRINESGISVSEVMALIQLDKKSSVRIGQLTYSEKKRVQLGCLLLTKASIYVFEEPDQNLDIESTRIFVHLLEKLKNDEKTICLLTMNMESAINFSDAVYRLDETGLHKITIEKENESDLQNDSLKPIQFEKIPTKIDDKIVLFDPLEIDYIEGHGGQSLLYIKEEVFPSTLTLNELEKRLTPFGFFRCHRSYIVNLQKVREVITWTRNSYSLILEDYKKTTIPLSKSKMAVLKEMIGI